MIYTIMFFGVMLICSIAGLGGGIILKPLLDFLGIHSLEEISFISAIAMITMATVSVLLKFKNNKAKFEPSIVLLIGGSSIIGGIVGTKVFNFLVKNDNPNLQIVQSILLLLTIVFVLFAVNFIKIRFKLKNPFFICLIGLVVGLISTFIGISGGIITVALFSILFSMDMKTATLYSLIIVILSQLTKLIITVYEFNVSEFNLSLLKEIVIASILAGVVAVILVKKLGVKLIFATYNAILISIVGLIIYNLV